MFRELSEPIRDEIRTIDEQLFQTILVYL